MKQNYYTRLSLYIILSVSLIIIIYPIGLNFFISDPNSKGTFGDSFGALNTFFSALAFCGIVISIVMQKQNLEESKYEYLHERMTNFVYVQLERYEKALEKLEFINNGSKIYSNEALYFLYENLEPISLNFANTREERLNRALNARKAILQNLNLIKDTNNKLLSFILSTDNCFLTLNEILNTSKLTLNDKTELKDIFNNNLGFMFPRIIENIYNTVYLARMFRFELAIEPHDISSVMNILNRINYFHIFHHSKKA
ncbi:hypothetical protein [Chryseobacterium camelliae]|uniref:hypothetical protein n=1 Tax=Chryseobacterium camelliae TaxID=1265445 RepID=UPI002859B5BB|nr:hypothetical protein [Chryseobacterium camelliae]MDR6516747.1 hypothetical protein [Chryseobacterium camelliae]